MVSEEQLKEKGAFICVIVFVLLIVHFVRVPVRGGGSTLKCCYVGSEHMSTRVSVCELEGLCVNRFV